MHQPLRNTAHTDTAEVLQGEQVKVLINTVCVLGVFPPVNLRCNLFRLTTKLENCSEDRLHMFFKQKQRAEEEQSCSDFSPLPHLPRLSSFPRP